MNNKDFDCVQLQREIREKHWKEAGENFDGLMKYLDKRIKKNVLLEKLLARKEKASRSENA